MKKTSFLAYPFFVLACWLPCSCASESKYGDEEMTLENAGFEVPGGTASHWNDVVGWHGNSGEIRDNGFYSPPEGKGYAYQKGNGSWISQPSGPVIKAGMTYSLKLWTRSVNEPGNKAMTTLQAGFLHNGNEVVTTRKNVNAPRLKGAAATEPNDDGANIWIDGEYRHQFNELHMYQPLSSDPIEDPWLVVENSGYDRISGKLGWAVGNVIAGDQKYIYGTFYQDRPPWYSSLTITRALSENLPDYQWSDPELLLEHAGSEFPWVLDAHGCFDKSTGRLWMSWGGGICYVTEMDPATGMIKGSPESKEFDQHPREMHVPVATWPETRDGWDGDQWSSAWVEGPALYKRKGYWYYLASYGHLGLNYTIRLGRGSSPTGPFFDKEGVNLMEFDEERDAFGNYLLLGAEGEQLVPGHPHIWEENGNWFLGYDFRNNSSEEMDYMGIRRLYWIDDWPTIWMPAEISFRADDHPELIGKKLEVGFRNAGEAGSELGVDKVSLSIISSKESVSYNHSPWKTKKSQL